MGSLPRLETGQHRNYTGAQQAAPSTPHIFVLSQSLSAALHRPHAATDVVRLCAHLHQTLNHANSSVPHGMLPARRSEVNRNPGSGVTIHLRRGGCRITFHRRARRGRGEEAVTKFGVRPESCHDRGSHVFRFPHPVSLSQRDTG